MCRVKYIKFFKHGRTHNMGKPYGILSVFYRKDIPISWEDGHVGLLF
jgi:hypothetical protein